MDRNIIIEGQSFPLPLAIGGDHIGEAELVMPISALTLGGGTGKATIQWLEQIEGRTLYFVKVGDLTLFSIENGEPKYSIGDVVDFGIDMRFISIEDCGITPLDLENKLCGKFIKEKGKKSGTFNFYMSVDEQKVVPTNELCKKLFSCKGTKIFSTPLEYIFNAHNAIVVENGTPNSITGTVTEVLDYGEYVYSRISLGQNILTVQHNGTVGEQVSVCINGNAISVKDTALDIIIA